MFVVGTIMAIIMLIPDWNGEQGSTQAPEIDTLFDVMIVISSYVFSIVIVALAYAVWKFRAKPGDESDGEPIHGNTKLEIIWTVIPTIIVIAGGIYSWIVLDDIEAKSPNAMPLQVTAQQYEWTFRYPDADKISHELHVPVDQPLDITVRAQDVLHSFWVPEWRIKRDLVPYADGNPTDIDNDFTVTPNKEGSFQLICTELCGIGHSTMRAPVVVESEADFQAWLKKQEKTPPDAFTTDSAGGTPSTDSSTSSSTSTGVTDSSAAAGT
jgi:cytochrome c oxidase subunit 2